MPLPSTSWRKPSSCSSRDAPFEKGARVDAGRAVTLEEDDVAAEVFRRRAEEVIEADVVERRRRCERRDVAAEFANCLCWRARPSPSRSSARSGADALRARDCPGYGGCFSTGIVLTYGVSRPSDTCAPPRCASSTSSSSNPRARSGPFDRDDGAHRFEPLLGLLRIRIVSHSPLPFRNWRGFLADGAIQSRIRRDPNDRANRSQEQACTGDG